MKVYLDVCSFNRPLDLQDQTRVRLETEAVLSILELCAEKVLTLAISDVVIAEIFRTTNIPRRDSVLEFTKVSEMHFSSDRETALIAIDFQKKAGLTNLDSLHLALCEQGRIDFFLTTDDALIKKAGTLKTRFTTLNPVDFIRQRTP